MRSIVPIFYQGEGINTYFCDGCKVSVNAPEGVCHEMPTVREQDGARG